MQTTKRWLRPFPRWLLGLLAATATFFLFAFALDSWSWAGAFVIGALVGLDQAYDLSDRADAYVRRFEWDKTRVALRTVYFGLIIGGILALSSLDERMIGDEGSLGLLYAGALGGAFLWAVLATATETPEHS